MVTVGYGDITPKTKIEKILTMGFTIINCAVFAYTVNVIGTIITERENQTQVLKKNRYLAS